MPALQTGGDAELKRSTKNTIHATDLERYSGSGMIRRSFQEWKVLIWIFGGEKRRYEERVCVCDGNSDPSLLFVQSTSSSRSCVRSIVKSVDRISDPKVLMRLCRYSNTFTWIRLLVQFSSQPKDTIALGKWMFFAPHVMYGLQQNRQDKSWRVVAVPVSASHKCLRIRDVDLMYHAPRGDYIWGVSDCHDWLRIHPFLKLGLPMRCLFDHLGCNLSSKYFWHHDVLTYCKGSTSRYFELPLIQSWQCLGVQLHHCLRDGFYIIV